MIVAPCRVAAVALLLAVAGCSAPPDQPNATADLTLDNEAAPIENRPAPEPRTAPEPTVATTNAAAPEIEQPAIPPEAPVSHDEQMLDDAGASGMTARMPDRDGGDAAANGVEDGAGIR